MEGTRQVLELLRDHNLVAGSLRGVFHLVIGRRISDPNGRLVAEGVTWRLLAALLKEMKFDRELVRELGVDPDTLAPKDREKFWYNAIALAKVDGDEARKQADALTTALKPLGLIVGPSPSGSAPSPRKSADAADEDPSDQPNPSGKKRKKT